MKAGARSSSQKRPLDDKCLLLGLGYLPIKQEEWKTLSSCNREGQLLFPAPCHDCETTLWRCDGSVSWMLRMNSQQKFQIQAVNICPMHLLRIYTAGEHPAAQC